MTKQEWNEKWWAEFHVLRMQMPAEDIVVVQKLATVHVNHLYGPCPDDGLGLKDTIVRALALRWLRGKISDLRGSSKETGMGKVLKFLDGWKLVIGVVLIFGAKTWDAAHNGHTGDIVGSVLSVLGWSVPGDWTGPDLTAAAGGLVALIGLAHKLIKAGQQIHAGSSVAGALTTEGYAATKPTQTPPEVK